MVNMMIQCINEINQVEAEAAAKGELPKLSQNKIQAKQYLFPLLRQGALFVEFADIYHPGASLYGAVPSSLPPSSAAFPSASPHLSTKTRGKSFRSIFK